MGVKKSHDYPLSCRGSKVEEEEEEEGEGMNWIRAQFFAPTKYIHKWLEDGAQYVGDWHKRLLCPHGTGRIVYCEGEVYEGSFIWAIGMVEERQNSWMVPVILSLEG